MTRFAPNSLRHTILPPDPTGLPKYPQHNQGRNPFVGPTRIEEKISQIALIPDYATGVSESFRRRFWGIPHRTSLTREL